MSPRYAMRSSVYTRCTCVCGSAMLAVEEEAEVGWKSRNDAEVNRIEDC